MTRKFVYFAGHRWLYVLPEWVKGYRPTATYILADE